MEERRKNKRMELKSKLLIKRLDAEIEASRIGTCGMIKTMEG